MSQTSSGPAIAVEGLAKSSGDVRALRGIDLSVPRGTVLGLLGPNGAGMTTAVRILTTLLLPDAGRALMTATMSFVRDRTVLASTGCRALRPRKPRSTLMRSGMRLRDRSGLIPIDAANRQRQPGT